MTTIVRWRRHAAWLCAMVVLAGCVLGPNYIPPAPPDTDRYTYLPLPTELGTAQGITQLIAPATDVQAAWWQLFGSKQLDTIVGRALANSPTLQAAEATLRVAQDNLAAGSAVFFPRLDANVGAERGHSNPIQQGSPAAGGLFNLMTVSASVSYPLDLFGGERRSQEALAASLDVQQQAKRAAFLTLTGNIVNACIAYAGYMAQMEATQALIDLEKQQLIALEAQVKAGMAPYSNLLIQRSLIAADEALLAPLRQKISRAQHLIALLQGDFPADSAPPEIALDDLSLPTNLPLSLPSALVRQRPDILASAAQLHVASAQIGVATAAMYPSFTLNGSYGAAGANLSSLFGPQNRFWNIVPSLSAPLFHGGSLRAQRLAALDTYEMTQANYRLVVLTAFGQVADVLRSLEQDALTLQAYAASEKYAQEAMSLTQVSYRAGLASYIELLNADSQRHIAAIATMQATAQRHQDTVALFVALGGGWWNAPVTFNNDTRR